MSHRQKDIWDQPWVLIAVIVGVIAVVAIALLVFFGGSPAPGTSPVVPVTVSPATTAGASPAVTVQKTTSLSTTTSVVTLKATTPVTVPQDGVFVKVSYLGGFSGTYGVNGIQETVTGSGDRVYAVNRTGGTLQAAFQKRDGSTSHEMTVEIWKGGTTLTSKKNSSAYGFVSISSTV